MLHGLRLHRCGLCGVGRAASTPRMSPFASVLHAASALIISITQDEKNAASQPPCPPGTLQRQLHQYVTALSWSS